MRLATRPLTATQRRYGVVYAFDTYHPETGDVVIGYVGQTYQDLADREAQHRAEQPWADLIVGRAYVLAEGWWTDDELDTAELRHIHGLLPLYNVTGNMANPYRIPKPVARRQRLARDPQWRPVKQTPTVRRRVRRRVRASRFRRVAWPVLWLALAVLFCYGAGDVWSGWENVTYGGVTSALTLWLVRSKLRTRRRR